MSASNKKSSAAKSRDPLQKPWQRQTKAKAAVSLSATVGQSSPKAAAKETAKAPRQEESKVYGENACRELFRQRPEAIIRLYINSELAPRFADLMKYLAQQKRAYHLVDETELEKVAGSQHHGGIVLLVKRKPVTSLALYLHQKRKQDCLLALDGVGNPYKRGYTIYDFLL